MGPEHPETHTPFRILGNNLLKGWGQELGQKDQRRPDWSEASAGEGSLSTENPDPNWASEIDSGFPVEVVHPLCPPSVHMVLKAQRKVF